MPDIHASVVEDRDLLLKTLRGDPVRCAYMLGDLDEAYWDLATWYGAGAGDDLDAVLMVYDGLSMPVMITWGQGGAMERIVQAFHAQLPGRALTHLQPHHVAAIDQYFGTEGLVPMLRMGLTEDAFEEVLEGPWEIEPLNHRHTGEIVELQRFYPDNFFEPTQIGYGHYYGVHQDDMLVSVAGVHVFSREVRVGVLGNIVTHPDYRGRGLSTACTSHLCRKLFDEGVEIVALNVKRQNRSAVSVYEKLGFRYHDTYLEGLVEQTPSYDQDEAE
ncbi:MAG: GNAT family N-acetyltransferase [Myxococcota bacterium]